MKAVFEPNAAFIKPKPNYCMMRRFTHYLLMLSILSCAFSCNDEEVEAPPKSTLNVDKTAGLVGDTEFAFTITQVNADAIALLPYGADDGDAGIPVTNFENGQAVIHFSYERPGTFNAIVRTNNHSGDGNSIRNSDSAPVQIVVTSDDASITDFSFETSTKTEIDQDARTITVTVPYGTDLTALKANFTASAFSTVSVGANNQESGVTPNNFSSPVIYKVTADDETTTSTYTVTVLVTDVETDNTIKSVSAKATSFDTEDKALGVSVDNTARTIVVYDTLDTPAEKLDSVRIGYALNGVFANMKLGGKKLKQDSLLNLVDDNEEEFVVFPEDSAGATGTATYAVYATDAPRLNLSFPDLSPAPIGSDKPVDFTYDIKVLSGTTANAISTTATIDAPLGVTVSSIKVVDGPTLVVGVPSNVNYTLPVKIELTVVDTRLGVGVTYKVQYNVNVSVVE
jgi:hypothetical protein